MIVALKTENTAIYNIFLLAIKELLCNSQPFEINGAELVGLRYAESNILQVNPNYLVPKASAQIHCKLDATVLILAAKLESENPTNFKPSQNYFALILNCFLLLFPFSLSSMFYHQFYLQSTHLSLNSENPLHSKFSIKS